jgi:hypothetical protein
MGAPKMQFQLAKANRASKKLGASHVSNNAKEK